MRTRIRAAVAVAALSLALAACSSSGGDDKPSPPASSNAAASPTVDRAAARQDCVNAWVKELKDGTASADNEPAVCGKVPGQSAEMYADALLEYNRANRQRLDDCLADASCTEMPIPSEVP